MTHSRYLVEWPIFTNIHLSRLPPGTVTRLYNDSAASFDPTYLASILALQTLSDEGAATLPFSFLCALSALSDGCGITPANAATKSVFVSDGTSPTGCVVLQVRR